MVITLHDERRSIGSSSVYRRSTASDETNRRSQSKSLSSSLSKGFSILAYLSILDSVVVGVGKENLVQLPDSGRLVQGYPAPSP
jgi:hypothetical protein